jgi:hypothetical protein
VPSQTSGKLDLPIMEQKRGTDLSQYAGRIPPHEPVLIIPLAARHNASLMHKCNPAAFERDHLGAAA